MYRFFLYDERLIALVWVYLMIFFFLTLEKPSIFNQYLYLVQNAVLGISVKYRRLAEEVI